MYKPPYQITNEILNLSMSISCLLGRMSAKGKQKPSVRLRRDNQIKTIHTSLAIEGNQLTFDQVTALFGNRRVVAPKKDIDEVLNAIAVYEDLKKWNEKSIFSMKAAHKQLLKSLAKDAGHWRKGNVGVFAAGKLAHMAPPAKRVPELMKDLFGYLKRDRSTSLLIRACVFHYELEFIHPFSDGNGRMGRLWQQLILMQENPIFEMISVESVVRERQAEYYRVLGNCDKSGESTEFIEYSLGTILDALKVIAS